MKYFFLALTLLVQFLSVLSLKLLDNFGLIIGVFAISLLMGGFIRFSKSQSSGTIAALGWGLFYGSLASLLIVLVFIVWLSFNFPR